MKSEEILRVKDNISEYGNNEYYEKSKSKSYTPFNPMSCFYKLTRE